MVDVSAQDRLILPLDFPTIEAAEEMIARLDGQVNFFKIGMELQYAGGMALIDRLLNAGHQIFLDVKLLDIDNTVEQAVRNIAKMGVKFVTLHAYPKAMAAAVRGRGTSGLQLLGVSVLTSMDQADLADAGYDRPLTELVVGRAQQAVDCGMDGLVCSPHEAAQVRRAVGSGLALVTPGIRTAGSAANDQKRIMTPYQAIADGADYLVVGRSITAAGNPAAAAAGVIAEISTALQDRTAA